MSHAEHGSVGSEGRRRVLQIPVVRRVSRSEVLGDPRLADGGEISAPNERRIQTSHVLSVETVLEGSLRPLPGCPSDHWCSTLPAVFVHECETSVLGICEEKEVSRRSLITAEREGSPWYVLVLYE